MSNIEDIIAEHRPEFRCGARSAGPITVRHEFNGETSAKVLQCTRQTSPWGEHLGGEDFYKFFPIEDHVDGNCCYSPHRFTKEQAGERYTEPRDRQRCVKCRQEWPCDVARLVAEQNQPQTEADLGAPQVLPAFGEETE